MNEQEQTSKNKELDITDIKRYAQLVNDLSWQIDTSLDFILEEDVKKCANNTKVAQLLEVMLHVYPSCFELIRQLKGKIDDLPEFITVIYDSKEDTNEISAN